MKNQSIFDLVSIENRSSFHQIFEMKNRSILDLSIDFRFFSIEHRLSSINFSSNFQNEKMNRLSKYNDSSGLLQPGRVAK